MEIFYPLNNKNPLRSIFTDTSSSYFFTNEDVERRLQSLVFGGYFVMTPGFGLLETLIRWQSWIKSQLI